MLLISLSFHKCDRGTASPPERLCCIQSVFDELHVTELVSIAGGSIEYVPVTSKCRVPPRGMLLAAGVMAMDMSVGGWLVLSVLTLPWPHPEIKRNISIVTNNVIGKRGVFVMVFPLNQFEFSTVISVKIILVSLARWISPPLRDAVEMIDLFVNRNIAECGDPTESGIDALDNIYYCVFVYQIVGQIRHIHITRINRPQPHTAHTAD